MPDQLGRMGCKGPAFPQVTANQPAHVHRERPAVAGAAGRCTSGSGLARQRGHAVIPARSPGSPAPLSSRHARPAGPRRPGAMIMAQVSLEPHRSRGYGPVKLSMTALTVVAVLAPMTAPTTVSPG